MEVVDITRAAAAERLEVLGGFHPDPEEALGATLILLGPAADFWDRLTAAPEWGGPDPVDRWSTRVIGAMAARFGGRALFPFGGPPWHPFIAWAQRTGRIWQSPVTLLVHDTQGLMVSIRGALALPTRIELPTGGLRPCDACAAPCRAACPVGALTAEGYDVAACKAHVTSAAGEACRAGCLVRRACPISQAFGRDPAQSAYHMGVFAPC